MVQLAVSDVMHYNHAMNQRLQLIQLLDKKKPDGHRVGLFLCACGNTKELSYSRFKLNLVKSCGCLVRDTKTNLKHGYRGTKTYASWMAAKFRCSNPNGKDYARYGGSGVQMCDRWLNSFENFLEDMGERPDGMSLDRIDTTKGYEPGNCRWATREQQQQNKRGSYEWFVLGKKFDTGEQAAVHFNVSLQSICRWVKGQKPNCYRKRRYE